MPSDQDSLGKALMLESTKRMHHALDLLERFDQLTYADVRDMITVGVWNQEIQKVLLQLLDSEQAKRNHGGAPSPGQVPGLERELRQAIPASFHIADKVGGISGIGSMVFRREDGFPWRVCNPNVLIANYYEGQFGRISGLPRTGKTNLACVIIEEWLAAGNVAFSNIVHSNPVERLIYTRTAKELFNSISYLPEATPPIRWLFVLDEGGLIYSKADASTRRAKDLDKLVRVIGKLHGSMIIIEQRAESVPTILQEFSTSLYYTHKPGVVTIDLRGPALTFEAKVHGFPETKLAFDTYDIAFFSVDVDIQEYLEALASPERPGVVLRKLTEGSPP